MALGGSAARRYAEALYDIASAENAVDTYRTSLDRLVGALDARALRALREPSVPVARRLASVAQVTADQPGTVRSLLALLVQRDRIALIPEIARAYGDLVDRRAGIAKATITTAVELDQVQRDAFVQRLERSSGKRIQATFAVDPTLLGGAAVQVGDHLVDTSVRAQLEALRTQLAS